MTKKAPFVFIVVFLVSAIVFIVHVYVVGDAVWGDGRYYYEYVQSLVVDGKLVANKFSPGAPLFWLPFFLLGQNSIITGIGCVIYGVAGLYLIYLTAQKYFTDDSAIIAVLGFWLSSNLFFYTSIDPINSHSVSFFLSSLAFYLINKSTFFVGLVLGLLALTRNQDIIFFFLFLPLVFNRGLWKYLAGGTVGVLPQMIIWKLSYGVINSPYFLAGERFDGFSLQKVLTALFSFQGGLFSYSPVILLGFVGLFYVKNIIGKLGLVWFALATFIISSWHDPVGGEAYGNRLFITGFPFFIIGLGALINKFRVRKIQIGIVLIVLSIINLLNIIFYLKNH